MALIGNLTVSIVAKTEDLEGKLRTTRSSLKLTQEQAEKLGVGLGALGISADKASTGVGKVAKETEKTSTSLLSSTKSALGFAGALTGVQLGISAIGNVVQSAVGHVVSFESAMANVNTLGNNSVEVQARLREELLKLPAVLGDSTTLAKGLYDVLSAGIAPAEAVAFLATSASLAKAGLASVDVTTQALTKTMAAFNIPIKDAGQLADVLFKVVDLGQGSLSQFAGAFPQVTQGAAAMGLSFKDTAAAMATLTQTFKNADTAGTGFRSLLSQLVTNSGEFAKHGVNITKVIGEQGLSGVLRVLQDLTGGNVEKMRLYVNDIEGLAAAQALTGPQFKLFLENQQKLEASTGVVAKGLKLQGETAQSTYDAMVAEAGKAAIALAPPFLLAFTAIARGARLYAEDANRAIASIKPIVGSTVDLFMRLFSSAGAGAQNMSKGADVLTQSMLALMGMTERTSEATRQSAMGMTLAATEADEFKTATQVLSKALTESTVKMTAAQQAADDLGATFKRAGVQTKEALQETADLSAKAFTDLLATTQRKSTDAFEIVRDGSGKILLENKSTVVGIGEQIATGMTATTQGVLKTLGTFIDDFNASEATKLPEGFQTAVAKFGPTLEQLGLRFNTTTDVAGRLHLELEKATPVAVAFAHALDLSGISAEAAAANYRKLAPALDAVAQAHAEAEREAAGFGTMLQRNIDLADLTLESTNKLNEGLRKASYQMDFADDAAGLRDQLARARQERGRVANQPDHIGTSGFREFTLKALDKEITILMEKLAALKVQQTDTLTTATAQTNTLTASTAALTTQTTAAATAVAQLGTAQAANSAVGATRSMGPSSFSPGLGQASFGQTLPGNANQGTGNQRPPGWNIPGRPLQRFAGGGVVGGSGGTDSQLILATPGERVSTPGQDRAISVSFGGDIVIHVEGGGAGGNPGENGRIAAQAFVDKLIPMIKEGLRRDGVQR